MALTEVVPEMNFNYITGNIFGTCNNDCSAKFSFFMTIENTGASIVVLQASTSATMSGGLDNWNAAEGSDTNFIIGGTDNLPMTGTYTDTGDVSYLYLKYASYGLATAMPLEFFTCGASPDAVVEQQTVA